VERGAQHRNQILRGEDIAQEQDDSRDTTIERQERARVFEDVFGGDVGVGSGSARQKPGAQKIEADAYLPGTMIT
jgi:hypothetical protein